MSSYRVIVAATEGGVIATAERENCTVIRPIREFNNVDTLDDTSLGDIGRLFTNRRGFIALARRN